MTTEDVFEFGESIGVYRRKWDKRTSYTEHCNRIGRSIVSLGFTESVAIRAIKALEDSPRWDDPAVETVREAYKRRQRDSLEISPVPQPEKNADSIFKAASDSEWSDLLKATLKASPEAVTYVEGLLPELKQGMIARIDELIQARKLDSDQAEALRLLFGCQQYSQDFSIKTGQWLAVTNVRRELAKQHSRLVPVDQRSIIFKRLIMANREDEKHHESNGQYLAKTIDEIVSHGTYSQLVKSEDGNSPVLTEHRPSEELARSLVLYQAARMLEFYYPQPSSD